MRLAGIATLILGIAYVVGVLAFAQNVRQGDMVYRAPTVNWINEARVKNSTASEVHWPLVATVWEGTNRQEVEFGLRTDGVVMWRAAK